MKRRRRVLIIALATLAWAGRVDALTIPLTVDFATLRAALSQRVGSDEGPATLWGTLHGCRSLTVRDIGVARRDGRLLVTAVGEARVGFGFLGLCIAPLSWTGLLETSADPGIGPDWKLRLRDPESRLYDAAHRPARVAGRIWSLVKSRFEDELASFELDLAPPVDDAKAFLRSLGGPPSAAPLLAALDTLHPLEAMVDDLGVQVPVSIDLLPAVAGPTLPEPPLAAMEVEAWERTLEQWDGFLVFVVRDLGLLTPDETLRSELLDILLRGRQELVAALAAGPEGEGDTVRRLFLKSWADVRAVVGKANAQGALHDRVLRYTTFILSGDALTALDAAAPELGLEISADGLRRLARMLEPEYLGDPLEYSDAVDADLRRLFGFHDPAALDLDEPQSRRDRSSAMCTADGTGDVTRRLQRWVPAYEQLEEYRDAIARLLGTVATRTASVNGVDARFERLYGDLVRTTAWQESCWRQFVRVDGAVSFLQSKSGDVGIMQVNRRVWRGFFDLKKLEWDIGYNAGAGAEILAQLLKRYGAREADARLENAARATYSAYNGGPDAYRRYRSARAPQASRHRSGLLGEVPGDGVRASARLRPMRRGLGLIIPRPALDRARRVDAEVLHELAQLLSRRQDRVAPLRERLATPREIRIVPG